jgi:hypothetical protein
VFLRNLHAIRTLIGCPCKFFPGLAPLGLDNPSILHLGTSIPFSQQCALTRALLSKSYNLLSRTRTTRTAAPPWKFRHTPAQPDPLLAQSTATGSPHSRWKFWKFAQLLEVHTATGSSGSLHSRWKFTQPLEVLEVCTATGSFASI